MSDITPEQMSERTSEFGLGWPVVAACMIGMMLGISAIPFYTLGIFAGPVTETFGWTRGQYQGAFTFMLLGALAGPFVGHLCDKVGTRLVALTSVTLFAISFACIGLLTTQSVWTFYTAWAVMAVVAQGTGPIPWTRAISEWFYKRRGLALGLALTGSGVAALIAPPVVTAVIQAAGWRMTYVIVGVVIFLIGFPAIFFGLRSAPKHVIDSGARDFSGMTAKYGCTLGEAVRSYKFWVIAVSFCFISLGVSGIISNLVPLLTDRGFSLERAALLASIIGASVILGRVIVGSLLDRYWGPAIAFVLMALPAGACLLLASADLSLPLIALSVFVVGFAAGAEFDIIAYFVTRYFGLKYYGKIYGVQYTIFFFGAGVAPLIYGRVYDATQSYGPVLYASAVAFLFSATLLLTLGRYPDLALEGSSSRDT